MNLATAETGSGLAQLNYSGDAPFITGVVHNPYLLQANGQSIGDFTESGIAGSIQHETIGASQYTAVRYVANSPITGGACRSQLLSWPVETKGSVQWQLSVMFGHAGDPWNLTASGSHPVLFWEFKSQDFAWPALSAVVDTDAGDGSKLQITFFRRIDGDASEVTLATVQGLSRHTLINIQINARLNSSATGNGDYKVLVNGAAVYSGAHATASLTGDHYWYCSCYMYNDTSPSSEQRAVLFKTAKMLRVQ